CCEESDSEHKGGEREKARRSAHSVEECAGRSEREECRAVKGEEGDDGHPGEDGVRAEQIPEGSGEVAVRVERNAIEKVREADAPDERGTVAPDGVRPEPHPAPARARALRPPLERDHADDEEKEHE